MYGNKNLTTTLIQVYLLTATIKFIKDPERLDQPVF